MTTPTYVVHDGHRWRVLLEFVDPTDGPMLELMRTVGPVGGGGDVRRIYAKPNECKPWAKTGVRRIISTTTERGRKIIFEYDTKSGIVSLRLSRQRMPLTTTLGGLYWTLQRQHAANLKRDRAFARRTRGRT